MAITKESKVQRVEVYVDGDNIYLNSYIEVTIDDPDDNELPITTSTSKHYPKMELSVNDDGDHLEVPTDMSDEPELVQTIAAAVWAD